MKGNEVIAEAAVRCGCDAYFGYPITPQSEVMETLMALRPWETTGMVVLQAESEVASINMVYGAASTGKRAMTSSSSPGISLMAETLSYLAGAELPCLVVNVSRGGPGLGTIQPSQADYFMATKGGGHGDFHLIVLAPSSVQEMHDFVSLAFDLAFKYRNPAMILADGVIGQMMEKVELRDQRPRRAREEALKDVGSWATTGKAGRARNIVTSLDLDPARHEKFNQKLQAKYAEIREKEVRYEELLCGDAEYLIAAYGISARIGQKAVELLRAEGVKVGLFRPITLFPFPAKQLAARAGQLKGILCVELSAGQMIEDVLLAVGNTLPVAHFGRNGGIIHSPNEVVEAMRELRVKNGLYYTWTGFA
jgi:2-oxoglutarate ferredoxin oxidoreductase subunit alpha